MSKTILVALLTLAIVAPGCGSSPTKTIAEDGNIALVATSFEEFPLVWLGESYDSDGDGQGDMPLITAESTRAEPLLNPRDSTVFRPAVRSFTFAYGTCVIPDGDDSCPVPVSLHVYPIGSVPELEPGIFEGTVSIRGVDAKIYNGGALWFDTGDGSFSISFAGTFPGERFDQALRIAQMLVGANNQAGHITAGSDFRPLAPTPTAEATPDEPTPTPEIGLTPLPEATAALPE